MMTHYDYIIIGSGAGGCAAAYRLAQKSMSVLLIEKGEPLPNDGTTLDFGKVIGQGVFKSKEPWLNKKGRRFVPEEYFNVGGKTKWYGAALLRYGADEFEGNKDLNFLPWPISYRQLTPFYEEAEKLLGVRHFDVEPDLRLIMDRMQRNGKGWTVEPVPLGLAAEILNHREEAGHFDGFASVKELKSDAQCAFLERVATRENLSIITGQPVQALVGGEGAPQRITGVALRDGRHYTAGKVLLAAGAMHSPRLLQRYMEKTGLHRSLPNYRLVGRYYKRHFLTALIAFSRSEKSDVLRKTALLLSEKYPHSSIQPLGFGADVISSLLPRSVPRRTARFFGQRAYGFFLQTEDGSDEDNRVIAEAGAAGHSQPYPKLDYDPARLPQSVAEHRQLTNGFRRALLGCGYISFAKAIPLEGSAHACGTLVTGTDPERSVVDENGKVHGMENLYVVDGSILPRSSRVNPSLTIYAWALRVANLLQAEGGHYGPGCSGTMR
jgi:Choline dehydrogenase and related flavoproteins